MRRGFHPEVVSDISSHHLASFNYFLLDRLDRIEVMEYLLPEF